MHLNRKKGTFRECGFRFREKGILLMQGDRKIVEL